MSTNSQNPESKPPIPAPTLPVEVAPEVETPVETVDDLGYTAPEVETPVEEIEPNEKPTPTEELPPVEDTTGYGKEEDKIETPTEKTPEELAKEKEAEENKTDEEKAADLVKENIKKHIEDLPESISKEAVTKFAEENGLTDKQVEAYVKLAKDDQASLVSERETAVKEQRTAWKSELMTDPEFGGENFDKNIDRVNKLLEKHMPEMLKARKDLTDGNRMLPPYIMRDFLKLDKILNPTTKLTTGEPPAVKKEEVSLLDEMYS